MKKSIQQTQCSPSENWNECYIRSKTVGRSVYNRDRIELGHNIVYILNEEEERVAWADLSRCSFFHVIETPLYESELPELQ